MDKLLFLILGFLGGLLVVEPESLLLPVIAAVILSAWNSWRNEAFWRITGGLVFAAVIVAMPPTALFMPLMAYDYWFAPHWPVMLAWPAVLALRLTGLPTIGLAVLVALCAASWYWCYRLKTLWRERDQTRSQRDSLQEQAMLLERQQKMLRERQDDDIHIATLRERNRIARDIHDHVGHQLTRALLLTGAAQTAARDPQTLESLSLIRQTLTESLDNVRASVHGLHDDSFNLESALRSETRDFAACPVSLDYAMESAPSRRLQQAILAVVREALANIARHSGATKAEITLREHPGFYQVIIRDNGCGLPDDWIADPAQASEGLGFLSMSERVHQLGGQITFRNERGLVVFLTLPKASIPAGHPTEDSDK